MKLYIRIDVKNLWSVLEFLILENGNPVGVYIVLRCGLYMCVCVCVCVYI